jgi:hypothetical protein
MRTDVQSREHLGAQKNPEARTYFVYMLLGSLFITFIVFVLKE